MTLHIIGLPYSRPTWKFDGFSVKVRELAEMFPDSYLYWAGPNPTPAKLIEVRVPSAEQIRPVPHHWEGDSAWRRFNHSVIAELDEHLEDGDFICLPTGTLMQPIIEAFPKHLRVETGIGYLGVAAPFRVFESYAWLHWISGRDNELQPRWFDAVIPPGIEGRAPAIEPEDYLLFAGRPSSDKGYDLAQEIAQRAGAELRDIGTNGDVPYSRDEWLREIAHARAVVMPTFYVEPFGRIFAESLCCGTPVITTDWGAFSEYVEPGVDGFRCRSMSQFVAAVDRVGALDRAGIAERAQKRFSRETVREQYEAYFDRLSTLHGDGFYA